eukprot:PhF_6_TR42653/c0_g1_i3/m.64233
MVMPVTDYWFATTFKEITFRLTKNTVVTLIRGMYSKGLVPLPFTSAESSNRGTIVVNQIRTLNSVRRSSATTTYGGGLSTRKYIVPPLTTSRTTAPTSDGVVPRQHPPYPEDDTSG